MSDLCIHGIGTLLASPDHSSVDGASRRPTIPIKDYLSPVQTRRFGRVAKLMYVAAQQALEEASTVVDDSLGIVTATTMGEVDVSLALIEQIYRTRGVTLSPKLIPNSVHNSPAGYMTIAMNTHAPAFTLSQGWLSAEAALCAADDLISSGTVQSVLLVVGDEYNPDWTTRLRSVGADDLATTLETQHFSEGAIALVLSASKTPSNLGNICSSLSRFDGTSSGLYLALGQLRDAPLLDGEIHARTSAGGGEVLELLGSSASNGGVHLELDEGLHGLTSTGALTPIVRHIRATKKSSITTIGKEVDELGIVYWRGEL